MIRTHAARPTGVLGVVSLGEEQRGLELLAAERPPSRSRDHGTDASGAGTAGL